MHHSFFISKIKTFKYFTFYKRKRNNTTKMRKEEMRKEFSHLMKILKEKKREKKRKE